MADITAGGERFDFGRVVGHTFGLIGRNFVLFLVLAIIFVGLPQFAVSYGQILIRDAQPELVGWIPIVGLVVSLVTAYILQGALTRAAIDDLSGKGVRLGAALSDGFSFFFPLFVVALLVGLGLMIGFLLLIIPGIILAVRWAVSAAVVVAEREGPTSAIGRSSELTAGYRWAIFGLLLLYIVLAYAVTIGLALAVRTFGGDAETVAFDTIGIVYGVVSALSSSLLTLISTVGTASLYFELRRVKDGVSVEDLAKVFD